MPKATAERFKTEEQDETLSQRDRESLRKRESSIGDIAGEMQRTRQNLIDRISLEKIIPLQEKNDFIKRAKSLKDHGELEKLEREFQKHLEESRRKVEEFQETIKEKRGLLNKGEDETLLTKFMQQPLEEKEAEVDKLEEMLKKREETLKKADKLSEELQSQFKEVAEDEKTDYAAKVKHLQSLERTNKLYQQYQNLWNIKGIGEKTKAEYFKWFLSLPPERQQWSLDKAKREDIDPRLKLYEIHQKLPSEYQTSQFTELGKTERENCLAKVERDVSEKYTRMIWDKNFDMSTASKKYAQEEFDKFKGPEKLHAKISFFKNFPRAAQAEAKLRTQLERFPAKLWKPVIPEFNESSFEQKIAIINKIAQLETEHRNLQHNFQKFGKAVRVNFEKEFENAENLNDMKKIIDKARKYSEHRAQYFKLFDENKKYFSSSKKDYEDWYDNNIKTVEQAERATSDLKGLIAERKALVEKYNTLPPALQARCKNFIKLGSQQKKAEIAKLEESKHKWIAIEALQSAATELLKTGAKYPALKLFEKALTLDPENEGLKKRIQQLGGKTIETKKSENAQTEEYPNVLKNEKQALENLEIPEVETSDQKEQLKELKISEEVTNIIEKNLNTRGGKTLEDARSRAKKEFQAHDEEERSLAEEFLKKEKDYVLDKSGRASKIRRINVNRMDELKEIGQEILDERKIGDINTGRTDIELKKADGTVLRMEEAKAHLEVKKQKLAESRVQKALTKLKTGKVSFSPEQFSTIEKTLKEQMQEDVEDDIRLVS